MWRLVKMQKEEELYGVDISKDMFDAASKRLENKADLQIADACRLPYQDVFFDVVITTDTNIMLNILISLEK